MPPSKNRIENFRGATAVERYLRRLAPGERAALERLRGIISDVAPAAQEALSYGIPTFVFHGALVHYAAFRTHCSFFGGSGRLRERFRTELSSWPGTKSSIHFSPDRPIPRRLVERIVRWRIRENLRRVSG
jgi:uncharacterized protein YdhG (YjbR/CyaY superfamily)